MNTILIISIAVSLVLVLGIVIYLIFNKKKNKNKPSKLYLEKQKSDSIFSLANDSIVKPKDGYNYSMSFFIYLNDYTFNSGVWKHLLHKGTEIYNSNPLKYESWDDLSSLIELQNPGIWLHPNGTKLRLCFNINLNSNGCSSKLKEECLNDCMWNNNNLECASKDRHALKMNKPRNISENNLSNDITIEYIDIDIPYRELYHIAFVLENKVLNIYLNGRLNKIHKFAGEPEINTKDMYFNYPETFNGSIHNFNYFSESINRQQVEKLANDIPNIKEVPLKKRLLNYLRRFKIRKLTQTFFVK